MARTRLRHHNVAVLVGADMALLDVIKAVLVEEAHFHVVTATAPELVMPLIETTAPAVVILDNNLPEQSSWTILAQLRQHTRFHTLPVLMLTAVPEDTARVADLHDPAVELILKPFDLDIVLQRIQHLAQQQIDDTSEAPQKNAGTIENTHLPSTFPLLLLGDTGK